MANVCPICNNPLRQYGKDFYVCEVCETYFDKNENIVLTEQEWLQTATTEQLAEKLTDFSFWLVVELPTNERREKVRNKLLEWLKQPHTKERIMTKEELQKKYSEILKQKKLKPLWGDEHDPCEHCSANPKNGGSGLCNCTLACPKIT